MKSYTITSMLART